MSIGNAINSLPIAYAPLDGVGRYVAYALAHPSAEAGIAAVGSFIVDLEITLAAEAAAVPTPLKLANVGVSLSAESNVESLAQRIASAIVDMQTSGTASGTPYSAKAAAFAALVVSSAISMVVERVRTGKSSFLSLYTSPGARSSGNAINSFSLNASAINDRAGQAWRTIVTIFSPSANVVYDPLIQLQSEAAAQSQGNCFASGDISAVITGALSPKPNAIFNPAPALTGVAGISPFAMAYRQAGATFAQDVGVMSSVGHIIAGGKLSIDCAGGMSPLGSIIGDSGAAIFIEGGFLPRGSFLVDGASNMDDILAMLTSTGLRARGADVLMPAISTFGGLAWEQRTITISPVYASGWDGRAGLNIIGSIVYLVGTEDVVYQVSPESIVYAQVKE